MYNNGQGGTFSTLEELCPGFGLPTGRHFRIRERRGQVGMEANIKANIKEPILMLFIIDGGVSVLESDLIGKLRGWRVSIFTLFYGGISVWYFSTIK
jgi:hypothetical protein